MTAAATTPEVLADHRSLLAPRFPVLDALRAVGALAVLVTHAAFYAGDYGRHGTIGTLLARLDVGVALFFVLSGFLLSRPHLARAALGLRRPATGRYYVKRFLRIFPVYVVAVVLALALLEDNHDLGARDWLVTLGLVNTFVDPLPPAGLSQMWSLGVEATFYLVLPLLMLLATGRRRDPAEARLRPGRVLVVLAASVALTVWWHVDGAALSEDLTEGPALQWLPAYLSWFAVGIGLALVHVLHVTGSRSRVVAAVLDLGRQPGVCWAIAGGLMLVAATPLAGPTVLTGLATSESVSKNLLYAAVGGLLVLTGIVADPDGRFGRLFGAPGARRLGLISYSLFALHLMLLELIADWRGYPLFGGHGVQLTLLTLAAGLVAAEVVYRLVESPAMRLERFVPGRRATAASGSAATGTTER